MNKETLPDLYDKMGSQPEKVVSFDSEPFDCSGYRSMISTIKKKQYDKYEDIPCTD